VTANRLFGITAVRRLAARALVVPLALVAGAFSFDALLAPGANLWERWQAHDPASSATIDHAPWDALLAAYVVPADDGVNRFAYARVSAGDRAALETYVRDLARVAISGHDRADQFAYWVNLYNALTVKLVFDHFPVASIRDISISPGLFAAGPWDKKLIEVEGEPVSLNDIEHRILRPIWRDPRIHYAVNCAAIGCPNLQPQAFTAANTESLLEKAAREYINHPRGARVEGETLEVSSIYVWYREDFGGTDEGVIAHLKRYAEPGLAAALSGVAGIDGHRYDWSLNGTAD